MNEERSVGLILRIRPLTDSSLIAHWLTPTFGRIATVAKGARRAKSPYAGKLDLFYSAEITFSRSRSSDLHLLKEIQVLETHSRLRRDLPALHLISYFTVLVEQCTERETPVPDVWQLMSESLAQLARESPSPIHLLAFELRFLQTQGIGAEIPQATLSKETLQKILTCPWSQLEEQQFPSTILNSLNRVICQAIDREWGKIPPAREEAVRMLRTTRPSEGRE